LSQAPPEPERLAGMEVYATNSPPCAARMKGSDEDFRVEEVLAAPEVSTEPRPGFLPLYRVEKRSIDTFHLEREVSALLKSRVAYAGIKDRKASAVQYLSPTSTRAERPARLEHPNFTGELVGYIPRPLSRSMVRGNSFRVVLRGCCPEIGERLDEALGLAGEKRMPNFFGLQRFGSKDVLTHRVGKELIRQRFGEAVRLMLCEPRGSDDEQAAEARRLMREGNFAEGGRLLPRRQDNERLVAARMASRPDDPTGAIRAVPITVRRFYAQAYQSFIFNRTLSIALRKGLDIAGCERGDNWGEVSPDGMTLRKVHGVKEPFGGEPVPLIQFMGYAYRDYGSRFDACVAEAMKEEGVAARDFFVKGMQEVSVEGGFRRAHMTVADAKHQEEGDTAAVSFVLARGEYATVLLREAVKPSDPAAAGFA
jgi:tRNA pseudouridine13 synthase